MDRLRSTEIYRTRIDYYRYDCLFVNIFSVTHGRFHYPRDSKGDGYKVKRLESDNIAPFVYWSKQFSIHGFLLIL